MIVGFSNIGGCDHYSLDYFTRTEDPLSTTGRRAWVQTYQSGTEDWRADGDEAVLDCAGGATTSTYMMWPKTICTADQFLTIYDIRQPSAQNTGEQSGVSIFLRSDTTGDPQSGTCYRIAWIVSNATKSMAINKFIAGVNTSLLFAGTAFAPTSSFGATVVGDVIKLFINSVERASLVDNSIAAGDFVGVRARVTGHPGAEEVKFSIIELGDV